MLKLEKPSNEAKLLRLNQLLEESLMNDQTEYERTTFASGSFLKIQKYFKSLKKTSAIPPEMYLDAQISKDGKEITEMFNRYFHSNFTLSDYEQRETEAPVLLSEFHFEEDEKVAALKKLDVHKA